MKQIITTQYTYLGNDIPKSKLEKIFCILIMFLVGSSALILACGISAYSVYLMIN